MSVLAKLLPSLDPMLRPKGNFTSIENWKEQYKCKLVFICGGVISGLGKGILSSSIALTYKQAGYDVSIMKIDPYLV